MNWIKKLVQKEVDPDDTVLDLCFSFMQATLDAHPVYHPTQIQCKQIIGGDISLKYLDQLEEEGRPSRKGLDVCTPLPFPEKSFDVVLLFNVLEHLPDEKVLPLLEEVEGIARKKVILVIPNFFSNKENVPDVLHLSLNPLQTHLCQINKETLRNRGYKTKIFKERKNELILAVKNMRLKILHVWSQAGVSDILARYQRRMGHQAVVAVHQGFDTYSFSNHYGGYVLPEKKYDESMLIGVADRILPLKIRRLLPKLYNLQRSFIYYLQVSRMSRQFDIIHIHDVFIAAMMMPFKKKIMHWHGASVRRHWTGDIRGVVKKIGIRIFMLTHSNMQSFVSTFDLLKDVPRSKWVSNPVDTELFKKRDDLPKNKAVSLQPYYEKSSHAILTAKVKCWDLTIMVRKNPKHILAHSLMPKFLGSFGIFIDRHSIHSLSKTALEALAVGLKVVRWDGKIIEGLPREHEPIDVTKRWLEIYYRFLNE